MQHLIIGYGYCGYYLAKELLIHKEKVIAVSRKLDDKFKLKGLIHLNQDINTALPAFNEETILYYLIPPLEEGKEDNLLKSFLNGLTLKPKKIIYFGSSAVYGNHEGKVVNEESSYNLNCDRQYRRLNAEEQWVQFAKHEGFQTLCLRIAGIYGKGRLPISAAKEQKPLINPEEAPFSNYIYVKDLVKIAYLLAKEPKLQGIFNVADGNPQAMGSLQFEVAKALSLESQFQSLEEAKSKASPRLLEFIRASKKLDISALKKVLPNFRLTLLEEGIRESLD